MRIWDMDNDPNTGLYRSRSLDSLRNAALGREGPYSNPYIDQTPYPSRQSLQTNSFQQQQAYPWLNPTGAMPGGLSGAMPGGLSGAMPGGLSGGMPGGLSGGMPGGLSGGMSNGLSGGMPNGLSGGMSGGLSGIQPSPFGSPGAPQFMASSSQSIPIGPRAFQQPMQPGLLPTGLMGGMTGVQQVPKYQRQYDQFLPDPPEPLTPMTTQLPLGPLPPGENIFTRESAKMLKRNRNTVIGITIASILLAAALAGVIVLIFGFSAIPSTTPSNTQIGFAITRTDLTYGDELSNPLSYNYATTSQTFCEMITNSYLRGIFAVDSCVVSQLEAGSIQASMIIVVVNLGAESDTIFAQVASTIVAKSDADPSVLPVLPNSIKKLSYR